jgi:hypothetical protein
MHHRLDGARIPRATYRLQFHAGFRFDDATRNSASAICTRHRI